MSDWGVGVGEDGVVPWEFQGEFPCGYRWAVHPSREGAGVASEDTANKVGGVHIVKADWVADQAREAHDPLCACTFVEDGQVWPGYEFDVQTVTLTKDRYAQLLKVEQETADRVVITRGKFLRLATARDRLEALERAGVDNWEGFSAAMESLEDV